MNTTVHLTLIHNNLHKQKHSHDDMFSLFLVSVGNTILIYQKKNRKSLPELRPRRVQREREAVRRTAALFICMAKARTLREGGPDILSFLKVSISSLGIANMHLRNLTR